MIAGDVYYALWPGLNQTVISHNYIGQFGPAIICLVPLCIPYGGKFSLVQIFAEKRPDSKFSRFLFSRNAGRSDHTPTG